MKLDKAQMTSLATKLQTMLGPIWRVRVVEKTDPTNTFDPPCRYVEAVLLGIKAKYCDDGEYDIDQNGESVVSGSYHPTSVQDCAEDLIQSLAIANNV